MLDRSVAPPTSEISRPQFPEFEQVKLGSVPLTVLNQGSQPIILFEWLSPVNRYLEPRLGLSYYLFKMLTEGTSNHTAAQIAQKLDFYGGYLEITPTIDSASIKLFALKKFFPELLRLLFELITESVFPENEFQLLKNIRIQQIKQQRAKNNAFANLKFREMLYGEAHPYGRIVTEEAAGNISRDDLIGFKEALYYQPSLFLSGQVNQEDIDLVNEMLESIVFRDQPERIERPITGIKDATISREESTQASIRWGKTTINRSHPDTHRLKITNDLLGGFFGSRLMKNIREDKGLTYGIYSSVAHLESSSYWIISSEVLQEKVSLAKAEISKEINALRSKVPEPSEFETLINYAKGKFLGTFDSPFRSHGMIKSLFSGGLDISYLEDYFHTLETITPEDIRKTAETYFQEDDLTYLCVY